MPFSLVLTIIFLVITIGVFVWLKLTPKTISRRGYSRGELVEEDNEGRPLIKIGFFVALALTAFVAFFTTFEVVGTKNVGIVTSFNRPVDTMDNGWNWKLPWEQVHEWDGKLQNINKVVSARIQNQSNADFDLQLQYQFTSSEGVKELFRAYGNEDSVRDNKMMNLLQAAVNDAVKDFDPITALQAVAVEDRAKHVGMPDLSREAEGILKTLVPAGVEVKSLVFTRPTYDANTEERIKAFNAAIQNTAIAQQNKVTAQITKETNDLLAQTKADNFQQCLSLTERMIHEGRTMPPAWTCVGGGGNPLGLVLPSAK